MSALFSVLILVLLIVAVGFVGPRVTRMMRTKTNVIIIAAYLAVLAILVVSVKLVPSSALVSPLFSADVGGVDQNLGVRLAGGNFDAPEGFSKTESSFDVSAGQIVISGSIPNGFIYVGVKGTDVPDDNRRTIDVLTYTYGNVNFNKVFYPLLIKPPVCTLAGGDEPKLSIGYGNERTPVRFSQFNDNLTSKRMFSYSSNGGTVTSVTVVVLLPPGVTYTGESTKPLSEYPYA